MRAAGLRFSSPCSEALAFVALCLCYCSWVTVSASYSTYSVSHKWGIGIRHAARWRYGESGHNNSKQNVTNVSVDDSKLIIVSCTAQYAAVLLCSLLSE